MRSAAAKRLNFRSAVSYKSCFIEEFLRSAGRQQRRCAYKSKSPVNWSPISGLTGFISTGALKKFYRMTCLDRFNRSIMPLRVFSSEGFLSCDSQKARRFYGRSTYFSSLGRAGGHFYALSHQSKSGHIAFSNMTAFYHEVKQGLENGQLTKFES